MTLMPMASVMAVTEPKWVSVWGRFLWAMLLSMVLGSLLALLLPLGTVEEHCLTVLKGFYLLRSKLERAQPTITKCTRPSTELSLTSRGAALLGGQDQVLSSYLPITIRKEQRSEYYHVLEVANEGDVRPFIRFIAKCTETTLDTLLFATMEYPVALPEARPNHSGCKETLLVKP
uniref:Uncharacterized protein n=1 Tax=Moschus moschiferus TaxID=68415 RepID=A0A8C6CNK9_MOSMO